MVLCAIACGYLSGRNVARYWEGVKRMLVIGAVLIAMIALIWRPPSATPLAAISPAPDGPAARGRHSATAKQASVAVVYVVGAVPRPGLYRLRSGARADDAVRAAGGLLASADPAAVNLAERLNDGEEVLVPALGAATPKAARRRTSRKASSKSATVVDPVSVNQASADELAAVPGIGKTIAERIVAVRERDGPYQNLDDLLDVAGMTQRRLDEAGRFLYL